MIIADMILVMMFLSMLLGSAAVKIKNPAGLLKIRPRVNALLTNIKTCPDDWKRNPIRDTLYHNAMLEEHVGLDDRSRFTWRERRALTNAMNNLDSERIIQKTLTRGGE